MSKTLGIILAAGKSSRLYPATYTTTKQVLPIYDKPLIYYPLTTLMLAGVREFVIISNPKEKKVFQELFYDAQNVLGIRVHFAVQEHPDGIADAFNIVENHFYLTESRSKQIDPLDAYDRFALALGDNIFYGAGLTKLLKEANDPTRGAVTFAVPVSDPERFGVVEVDAEGKAVSLEEKPAEPKSNLAVTGLYFYPKDAIAKVKTLEPSARGELEITDLNRLYMEEGNLEVEKLLRGMVWFDTGTPDSMMEAAQFIQSVQKHQGFIVGSPHEVAYNSGWIDKGDLMQTAAICSKSAYGRYLFELAETKK